MMSFKRNARLAVLCVYICMGSTMGSVFPVIAHAPKGEAARNDAEKQRVTDKDKLQGTWLIMSISMQGKVIKREDKLDGWKETFDQDVTIQGDQFMHAQAIGGTFKLDETPAPRQINFPDKEGKLTFRGIYAFDGDTITMCVNGDGTSVRRPETFATKADMPFVLITLKKSPARK